MFRIDLPAARGFSAILVFTLVALMAGVAGAQARKGGAIQLNASGWSYIDSNSFSEAPWVWASMADGGSVAEQEIPRGAGIISVDMDAASVTATELTAPSEVASESYRGLPDASFRGKPSPSPGSAYQHLIFLPAGRLEKILADGIVSKSEALGRNNLGSAIVYTASLEGKTVLGPVYLDGVLMDPASFNAQYDVGSLHSGVLGRDDSSIPTMRSFTTRAALEEYFSRNGVSKKGFESRLFTEVKSYVPVSNGIPGCLDTYSVLFEHKNYSGWGIVLPFGLVNLPWPYYQNVSSLRTALLGSVTVLYSGEYATGATFITGNQCNSRSNLRNYGWNDRAASVVIF